MRGAVSSRAVTVDLLVRGIHRYGGTGDATSAQADGGRAACSGSARAGNRRRPRGGHAPPRFPDPHRLRRRPRRCRGLAAAQPAPARGCRAAKPGAAGPADAEQHADRPLRRADDGEPVVRPLLRLASERRRGAAPHLSRPRQRQRAGRTRHASTLGHAQWQGCGHPDPDHSWNGGREQLGSSLTDPRRSRTASSRATTTSSRSVTTTRATSGSSIRRAGSSPCSTASTAR